MLVFAARCRLIRADRGCKLSLNVAGCALSAVVYGVLGSLSFVCCSCMCCCLLLAVCCLSLAVVV